MSLEDYVSDAEGDTVFIHMFFGGEINAKGLKVRVETRYPWEGRIRFSVKKTDDAVRTLALRIPGLCGKWQLKVNGDAMEAAPVDGYVHLARNWQKGDTIDVVLEMPVRVLRANTRVREDGGRVALQRGPLVYCLEEADNGPALHATKLAKSIDEQIAWEPDLLGGVVTLDTAGFRERMDAEDTPLYTEKPPELEDARLRWIPYYAWANRGVGEMRVWVRQ
jgi:DUF1680 family protein